MLESGILLTMDESVATWLHEQATPSVTVAMRAVSILGWPPFVFVLTIIASWLLLLRRDWYTAALLAIAVGGGMLINTGVKAIVDRNRPRFEPVIATAYGNSFPSGHVAAATLLYGALTILAFLRIKPWRSRAMIAFVAVSMIELVSLSRLYLGVHYLSDVFAAQALGLIWLAISALAVAQIRRYLVARSQ
jgi:membrane-associated phospholipid phosphatase